MRSFAASTAGAKLGPRQLLRKLESLDIDEGVRVESKQGSGRKKKKLFVNRRPSGTFVIQLDDSQEFMYFDSARRVVDFIRDSMGKEATAWLY